MATVEQILNTDLPRPTYAFRPSIDGPISKPTVFRRASAAWRRDPVTGLYSSVPSGEPRIDGENQSIRIQPNPVTNLIDHRQVGSGSWFQAAGSPSATTGFSDVEGGSKGVELTDTSSTARSLWRNEYVFANDNQKAFTVVVWVKKDNNTSRFPLIAGSLNRGSTPVGQPIFLNTKTGEFSYPYATDGAVEVYDTERGFWEVRITMQNNGTGNDLLRVDIKPAASTTFSGQGEESATGSIIVDAPVAVRHQPVQTDSNGFAKHARSFAPILAGDLSEYPKQVARNADELSFFENGLPDYVSPAAATFIIEFEFLQTGSNVPADFNAMIAGMFALETENPKKVRYRGTNHPGSLPFRTMNRGRNRMVITGSENRLVSSLNGESVSTTTTPISLLGRGNQQQFIRSDNVPHRIIRASYHGGEVTETEANVLSSI